MKEIVKGFKSAPNFFLSVLWIYTTFILVIFFENLSTVHPHYIGCIATSVLHSIIPLNLLDAKQQTATQTQENYQAHVQEVLGTNALTERLFPEPGFLTCGYCKMAVERDFIAYHSLHCRSKFHFQLPKEKLKNNSNDIEHTAVRIEFSFLF